MEFKRLMAEDSSTARYGLVKAPFKTCVSDTCIKGKEREKEEGGKAKEGKRGEKERREEGERWRKKEGKEESDKEEEKERRGKETEEGKERGREEGKEEETYSAADQCLFAALGGGTRRRGEFGEDIGGVVFKGLVKGLPPGSKIEVGSSGGESSQMEGI